MKPRDPAFAIPGNPEATPDSWGMDIRTWLAGQALNGLLANPNYDNTPEREAVNALKAADALLELLDQ